MKLYFKALNEYKSLVGFRKALALLLSIFAARVGLPLDNKTQRLLQHWASFRLLAGRHDVKVKANHDREYEVLWLPNPASAIPLKFKLRAPISESSDILVFNQIFINLEYRHVLDWFYSVCPQEETNTIVDLGGNIGCAALFLSTCYPTANIFSLEPEPSNYDRLRLNLELNPGLKISPCRAAIWTESCKLKCVHDFRDKKESSSRFVELNESHEISAQQADAIDVRSLMRIAGFKCIDLLKMDVEGAEAALFRDADFQNFLKESVHRVAVEVHEEFIKIEEVKSILHSLGFQTNAVDEFLCGIK
jgi:FkbM family methyltransferase